MWFWNRHRVGGMVAAAAVVAITGFASSAVFATVVRVPFDELVDRADLVFHGRVVEQACRFGPQQQSILTDVVFEIDEVVLHRPGSMTVSGNRVVLTFAGGEIDGEGFWVTGTPTFEIGERVLLFTRHDGGVYANPLIGGVQGLFLVETDEATGVDYPLSSGRRFITGVRDGGFTYGSRVERIREGKALRGSEVVPDLRYPVAPRPADPEKSATAYAEVVRFEAPPSSAPLTLGQLVAEIRHRVAGAHSEAGGAS